MVEYKFTLNKGLARCLFKLNRKSNSDFVEIRTIGLTTSEWTNFQKLRYWNLIEKKIEDDTGKGGYWRISEIGIRFLTGKIQLPKSVIMYRNNKVRNEGELLSFKDITGGYEYRSDYVEQARNQIRGV